MKNALATISVMTEKSSAWANRLDIKGERIKQLNQLVAKHAVRQH
jgi:hypothetical protein